MDIGHRPNHVPQNLQYQIQPWNQFAPRLLPNIEKKRDRVFSSSQQFGVEVDCSLKINI